LAGKRVVEVGCGAGNTVFPLMKQHPDAFFYAFDFATHAVEVVKVRILFMILTIRQKHPEYDTKRCSAFVW
jgi:hypothetical protein